MAYYPINEYNCGGIYTIIENDDIDDAIKNKGGFSSKEKAEAASYAYTKKYGDSKFVKVITAKTSNQARQSAKFI